MVIVCEGAVDRNNKPIKSEYIRNILEECGLDARVTTLGHVQRGGSPSAFDRYMATLQGIEAVKAIIDSDPEKSPSIMIGIKENRITRLPLVECVKKTRLLDQMMRECKFYEAFSLRGPDFKANYEILQSFYQLEEAQAAGLRLTERPLRIAFVNCGAPCCGINAANRSIILQCLFKGHTALGIFNGFSGLLKGEIKELTLSDGPFHSDKGGSFLGMNRTLPSEDIGLAAYYLQQFKIDGLIIIGGFEAYNAQLELTNAREGYPAFDIPIVCLPATISNNVPGTDYSVGCDTALNIILECGDNLKMSASSSRRRAFVVDVQGGKCGYLALMGGLACGASCTYIPEEGITLQSLSKDIAHLKQRFKENISQGRLALRNEKSSAIYSAELISKIYENESEGLFDSRWATLGHIQQGGSPSPLDRIRATRLAVMCVSFIEAALWGCPISFEACKEDLYDRMTINGTENSEVISNGSSLSLPRKTMEDSSSAVIGIRGPSVVFTCCKKLADETDFKNRRPKHQWWLEYHSIARILAKNTEHLI